MSTQTVHVEVTAALHGAALTDPESYAGYHRDQAQTALAGRLNRLGIPAAAATYTGCRAVTLPDRTPGLEYTWEVAA